MRFRILGPLRVRNGVGWVPVRAGQQRVVLAVLLADAGRVVSVDRLVHEVWGEAPPRTAVKALQMYVMRLRRMLGDDSGHLLRTSGRGYELAVGDGDLDAWEFERLVAAGRRDRQAGRPRSAADHFGRALDLWRGPALSDVPANGSLTAHAARLEQARLTAVEDRIGVLLELGLPNDAVEAASALANQHPLRERPWAQLMMALHGCGGHAVPRGPS